MNVSKAASVAERRVGWTAETRNDLLQVIDFIAFDNPLTAQRILDRLRLRALSLDRLAERGRVAPELRGTRFRQHRELVVTPWRMFYTIGADLVRVVALFDGRRDLRDLLHDRFARASVSK